MKQSDIDELSAKTRSDGVELYSASNNFIIIFNRVNLVFAVLGSLLAVIVGNEAGGLLGFGIFLFVIFCFIINQFLIKLFVQVNKVLVHISLSNVAILEELISKKAVI